VPGLVRCGTHALYGDTRIGLCVYELLHPFGVVCLHVNQRCASVAVSTRCTGFHAKRGHVIRLQGLAIVPQQSAYIIERFGKFHQILEPGLHFLLPFVDRIAYTHSLKEEAISVSSQQAITRDNVSISTSSPRCLLIRTGFQLFIVQRSMESCTPKLTSRITLRTAWRMFASRSCSWRKPPCAANWARSHSIRHLRSVNS